MIDYDTVVEDSVHGIIPDNTLIPVSILLLFVNSGVDLNTSTPQLFTLGVPVVAILFTTFIMEIEPVPVFNLTEPSPDR